METSSLMTDAVNRVWLRMDQSVRPSLSPVSAIASNLSLSLKPRRNVWKSNSLSQSTSQLN